MNLAYIALALVAFEIKNWVADILMADIIKDQLKDRRYFEFDRKMRSLDPLSDEHRRMFIASLKHPPHAFYIPGLEYLTYISIHFSLTCGILITYVQFVTGVDASNKDAGLMLLIAGIYSVIKCVIEVTKTYYQDRICRRGYRTNNNTL